MERDGFYKTFSDLINQCQDTKFHHKEQSQNTAGGNNFNDKAMRNLFIEEHGQTFETVKELSRGLKYAMAKPQRLVHDDPSYYIAIDMLTNTYYICYRTLLMIDIDFYKDHGEAKTRESQLEEILERIDEYGKENHLKFAIYESRNGVHAFRIDKPAHYQDPDTITMMLDLKCDFFYVVYCYIRGWSVRLNRKTQESVMAYKYLGDVGDTAVKSDDHLLKLVDLHIKLVQVFKDEQPSSIYGV